ncbi:retrovirus-related Pol polyprotein from type-2 retrotransposable element R2DM [Trichonephila clavipes]|nr:retrovirus-related Pol polyprotein from type-2 retrotransposable element R2DM [Trichonephila clavipes]
MVRYILSSLSSPKRPHPHDGVIKHNYLLTQHLEETQKNKQDRFLAWLDISNAFGSVLHEVIINAPIANGIDQEFVSLVTNIYLDSTTTVFAGEGLIDPISIKRRQGSQGNLGLHRRFNPACQVRGRSANLAEYNNRSIGQVEPPRSGRQDGLEKGRQYGCQRGKEHLIPLRKGNQPPSPCCIPSAAADCDFYLVDTAFKLLTSRDEDGTVVFLGQLRRTISYRIHRLPTDFDLSSYLSGCIEGEYTTFSNALSNTWTQARKASSRQDVTWTFQNESPTISFDGNVLNATYRTSVMKKFHLNFKGIEVEKLLARPSQGKAMECVSLELESSHYFITHFTDWRFVHKALLNVTPLNGSKSWIYGRQRKCRKCGKWE